jgi:hypothetical protein
VPAPVITAPLAVDDVELFEGGNTVNHRAPAAAQEIGDGLVGGPGLAGLIVGERDPNAVNCDAIGAHLPG